jgi:hypothetical protein
MALLVFLLLPWLSITKQGSGWGQEVSKLHMPTALTGNLPGEDPEGLPRWERKLYQRPWDDEVGLSFDKAWQAAQDVKMHVEATGDLGSRGSVRTMLPLERGVTRSGMSIGRLLLEAWEPVRLVWVLLRPCVRRGGIFAGSRSMG